MNKLVIFLLIALPFVMKAQMTYVPDDNFEQALINFGLDSGSLNDSVPTKNIDTVTYLDVAGRNIFNLIGIQDFKALISLYCDNNHLSNLDVSYSSALKDLVFSFNQLYNLDISNNIYLEKLVCGSNNLTSLDVSKCTVLESLYCYSNKLTELNVGNNPNLFILNCNDNKLSSLDLSKCPALERLYCYSNILTSMDVSNNHSLRELDCYSNKLSNLDINKNIALKYLRCDSNELKNLALGNNYYLRDLYCNSNNLTSLEINKIPYLTWLEARNNPNLYCIQVIDSSTATNNSKWYKDTFAIYSTNCGYTDVDDYEIENESKSVSPNPASDYIEISYPPSEKRGEHHSAMFTGGVSIFDVLGVEVQNSLDSRFRGNDSQFPEGSNVRLDISSLSPGVYFVRIGDVVRKFIKI